MIFGVAGDPDYLDALDTIRKLHLHKSGGYGTDGDALANFTAVATISGEPAWLYPCRRSLEKLARVESLAEQGRYEELAEEFLDIASLMLCAEALRRRISARSSEEEAGPGQATPRESARD